jgi:hypothetical protein
MPVQRREIPLFSKNNLLKIGHNNVTFPDTMIAVVTLKIVLFIYSRTFFKLLAVNNQDVNKISVILEINFHKRKGFVLRLLQQFCKLIVYSSVT